MNSSDISHIFAPGGPVASHIPSYEYREGQVWMAQLVGECYDESQIMAIEAETGIGKSFAYLSAAFLDSHDHQGSKTVIATSTIALQHQLQDRDIPFLRKAMGLPIDSQILKGRNNYLCTKRLYKLLGDRSSLTEVEQGQLGSLLAIVGVHESGDRATLEFEVSSRLWARVCSDAESCLGYRCSHREGCFLQRARKKASEASIIIVNHHLLFADMMLKSEEGGEAAVILPEYHHLIVDEAHNIERNAVSYFTDSYDSYTLESILSTLYSTKRGSASGLVETLREFSDNPGAFNEVYSHLLQLRLLSDAFDTQMERHFSGVTNSRFIEPDTFLSDSGLLEACTSLGQEVRTTVSVLKECLDSCQESPESISDLYEARALVIRLKNLFEVLQQYGNFALQRTHVYWFEPYTFDSGYVRRSLRLTPLEFGSLFDRHLYGVCSSVLLTSATLTVAGSFSFWQQKVGLEESYTERFRSYRIPSPFDYRSRVLLALPTDAPDPNDYSRFVTYSTGLIEQLIELCRGGAMILFTSYAMLRDMYERLREPIERMGITVMKQNDRDTVRLMKAFVEDRHSVLFATQSFWEGMDAPGETLRLLIVCRLPFTVPTEPLFYAKKRRLEELGRKPFYDLALPEAAMKLKQGFGRLMRTSSDKGIVCILDPRLTTKSYGRMITASLPDCQRYSSSAERILDRAADFYLS